MFFLSSLLLNEEQVKIYFLKISTGNIYMGLFCVAKKIHWHYYINIDIVTWTLTDLQWLS